MYICLILHLCSAGIVSQFQEEEKKTMMQSWHLNKGASTKPSFVQPTAQFPANVQMFKGAQQDSADPLPLAWPWLAESQIMMCKCLLLYVTEVL